MHKDNFKFVLMKDKINLFIKKRTIWLGFLFFS